MHAPTHSPVLALVRRGVAVAFPLIATIVAANAQPYTGDPRQTTTLREIDQGLADQTPLSASARVVPIDLRQPTGFDQLFQLAGPGGRLETRGTVPTNGMFFRFSGGLTATFSRSVYAETAGGLQPLIPPGTVFSIGQKPAWGPGPRVAEVTPRMNASGGGSPATPAQGVARSARVPSSGASSTASGRKTDAVRTPAREAREPESLWTSEAYRRRLIERLIMITGPDAQGS